jgi:DNA-binding CsgD family transcriptional regulator
VSGRKQRPTSQPCRPRGLEALESEDGTVAVLSFDLPDGPCGALTPAESEVVAYLIKGYSNAAIAAARGGSTHTVANQIASAFRKLGVSSRLELVALAPLFGQR